MRRAASLTQSGEVAIHVRSASHGGRRLTEIAAGLGSLHIPHACPVFVNDRVDVAMVVSATGVHLPENGMPTATARMLVGPDVWIGRSIHSPAEAIAAVDRGADYVFLGPIWPTDSHPGHPGLGPGAISAAQPATVIAIGGVTPERVPAALEAGAYGVAAIRALWGSADPGATVKRLLLSFHS